MIRLLVDENVGDPTKRNKMGLLPQDIEHDTQYHLIHKEIRHCFRETLQETHEGDYMIITTQTAANQGKKKIILN